MTATNSPWATVDIEPSERADGDLLVIGCVEGLAEPLDPQGIRSWRYPCAHGTHPAALLRSRGHHGSG